MAKTQRTRLDEETQALLSRLVRVSGETEAELIRRGLQMVERSLRARRKITIVGLGKFESKVADLGSNKARLRRFGA